MATQSLFCEYCAALVEPTTDWTAKLREIHSTEHRINKLKYSIYTLENLNFEQFHATSAAYLSTSPVAALFECIIVRMLATASSFTSPPAASIVALTSLYLSFDLSFCQKAEKYKARVA